MSMEVVESKVAHQPVEAEGEENISSKENGALHEPIKFGSHGLDEPVKGEDKVSEIQLPKDAVDEWPEPKQIHSFWFVKYRPFEDQKLKAKFELSGKDLQKKHQSRSQLIDKLRVKRGERSKIISELKALGEENKQYWSIIDEKRKEIEPLQQALGQLRVAGGAGYGNRDRTSGICSSEKELNDVIKSLQYRIQHESIPLTEEKQILREIKQLESTRVKVVANAATRDKIQESMGEKDALQDQVKLIGVGLDDVRKNQKSVKAKLNQLDEIKEGIDNEIKSIEEELTAATEKRDKTFENIHDLRKQREEVNLSFYENRSLLIKAKELAAKKDVEGLRDLSEREVSKFISLWGSSKSFREDYERRILPSLDSRQMSRDGRIRNPGEQPILSVEAPPTRAGNEVAAKGSLKQPKEHIGNHSQAETDIPEKYEKDEKEKNYNSKLPKETNVKNKETTKKPIVMEDDEEYFVPEKHLKDPPKVKEVDEKKLKEMKREEEMAKAKQALERKKKLAEKAAAKAAIKAQKETEKKEKEREKRLKKAGAFAAGQEPEEQTEASKEVAEPEIAEDAVETTIPEKNRDRKNAVKYRKRTKGLDSLPKTLIKRKKATSYWMGAYVGAAAVAVLLLAIVGYRYFV